MKESQKGTGTQWGQSTQYRMRSEDPFWSEEVLKFLQGDLDSDKVFMHYTNEMHVAEQILKTGFQFSDYFDKTAVAINKDHRHLAFKHQHYRVYGNYIIVLSINREIYSHYCKIANMEIQKEISAENLLCEKKPYINDDLELVYTLHPSFVKGYIDLDTGKVMKNPGFNPSYNSELFEKNLENSYI
jgi:hypothetical protein